MKKCPYVKGEKMMKKSILILIVLSILCVNAFGADDVMEDGLHMMYYENGALTFHSLNKDKKLFEFLRTDRF